MKRRFDRPWLSAAIGHGTVIIAGWCIFYFFSIQMPAGPVLSFTLLPGKKQEQAGIANYENLERLSGSNYQRDTSVIDPSPKSERATSSYHVDSVSFDDLVDIGLSKRLAHTWVNYLEAGGKIKFIEDVERLYGITQTDIEKVRSALNLKRKPKKKSIKVDLNKAIAEEMEALPGIGPVLSKRLVKFRDRLGGFTHLAQVSETYGISDSLIQVLSPSLILSEVHPSLKINTASADDLARHPYINWKQAKVIVRYRNEHGSYKDETELLKSQIVDSIWIEKVTPYIDWNYLPMKE